MRSPLKTLIVVLALVLSGGMTLSAQHRGDRLHRILDPLGILPPPRQVLRTLDHVARTLPPPVVIRTHRIPVYDCGCDIDFRIHPDHPHRRGCRYERYGHRRHHPAPIYYDYDRPRHGRR